MWYQTGGPVNRHPKQTYKFLRTYPDGVLPMRRPPASTPSTEPPVLERQENDILSGDDPRLFVDRIEQLIAGRVPEGGAVQTTCWPPHRRPQRRVWGPESVRSRRSIPRPAPSSHSSSHPASIPTAWPRTPRRLDYYEQLDADPDKPLLNRPLVQTIPGFHVQTRDSSRGSGRRLRAGFGAARPGVLPAARLVEVTGELVGRPCGPDNRTTLANALAISCNSAFAYLGNDLGADALRTQARKFGFESSFDVPMTAATSRYPEDPDDAQTAMSAIGQFDVAATSLQMAMVTAAIANQGVTMSPYLVNQILAPDLTVLSSTQPKPFERAADPAERRRPDGMMVQVVNSGTGSNARIPASTSAARPAPRRPAVGVRTSRGSWRQRPRRIRRSPWRWQWRMPGNPR